MSNRVVLILVLVFCMSSLRAAPVDTISQSRMVHRVSASISPGYIVPTHYFLRGNNHDSKRHVFSGSADLRYSFSFPQDSRFAGIYRKSVQGIGVGVHSLFSHKNFGTPVTMYLHQSADVLDFSPSLSVGYDWNLGAAYGWKTINGTDIMLDSYTNPFISTKTTVYVAVGLYLAYSPNRSITYRIGPEYTHFSNGDTSYPNHGVDLISLKMEVSRNMYSRKLECSGIHSDMGHQARQEDKSSKSAMRYDLMLYGGLRADKGMVNKRPYIFNEAFPVAGVMFNPLYSLTKNISAGLSADFIFDRSSDLIVEAEDYGKVLSYGYPSPLRQMALGLSLRGELTMPIFSVNLGFGYNLVSPGDDLKGCYALFILKSFITDRLNLNFGYRLSTNLHVRNLIFGLGWSFGSTASEPVFRPVKYKQTL